MCREVGTKYRESNEEAITVLLCGELRQEFDENANREFEYAFAVDLRDHSPFSELNWVSHGLIGLWLTIPRMLRKQPVSILGSSSADLKLSIGGKPKYPCIRKGLLVQKAVETGKVGKLTKVQVLPAKLEYTAFVLYMYAPGGPELAPFAWVCADGRQLPAVQADLAKLNGTDSKPDVVSVQSSERDTARASQGRKHRSTWV